MITQRLDVRAAAEEFNKRFGLWLWVKNGSFIEAKRFSWPEREPEHFVSITVLDSPSRIPECPPTMRVECVLAEEVPIGSRIEGKVMDKQKVWHTITFEGVVEDYTCHEETEWQLDLMGNKVRVQFIRWHTTIRILPQGDAYYLQRTSP